MERIAQDLPIKIAVLVAQSKSKNEIIRGYFEMLAEITQVAKVGKDESLPPAFCIAVYMTRTIMSKISEFAKGKAPQEKINLHRVTDEGISCAEVNTEDLGEILIQKQWEFATFPLTLIFGKPRTLEDLLGAWKRYIPEASSLDVQESLNFLLEQKVIKHSKDGLHYELDEPMFGAMLSAEWRTELELNLKKIRAEHPDL